MRLGEVLDVDVVADARAVGGVVVVAEDDRCLAVLQPSEHDRDEVHDGGVGEFVPAGTSDVEVTQLHGVERGSPHLRGSDLVVDHPLADELRLTVGVDGTALEILRHHVDIGHAVGRG